MVSFGGIVDATVGGVQRQFDDESGGGVADWLEGGAKSTVSDPSGTATNAAEWSVSNPAMSSAMSGGLAPVLGGVYAQLDSEPGGGGIDEFMGGTADLLFESPDEGANYWFGGIGAGDGQDSIDLPGGSISEEANKAIDWSTDAADNILAELWKSTTGKLVLILVSAYLLGQLFDLNVGGARS